MWTYFKKFIRWLKSQFKILFRKDQVDLDMLQSDLDDLLKESNNDKDCKIHKDSIVVKIVEKKQEAKKLPEKSVELSNVTFTRSKT